MLMLGKSEVNLVLDGAESDVLAAVREAYELHALGRTAVPHSVFLRFPADLQNRIIALPAYLGTRTPVAGVKWVASFPGNLRLGQDRASASMILNCPRTGFPEVFMEAAAISAQRTAASAALAAVTLGSSDPESGVSQIGCGPIGFEVLRYLQLVKPELDQITLYDLDRARAESFAARVNGRWPRLKVEVAARVEEALAAHPLVTLATTASVPHLAGEHLRPGALVLHLSLRDLSAETIQTSVNIVDDADHVCRAATSLHLAEQQSGGRDFIAASLGELLVAGGRHLRDDTSLTVFSPFGLGCLDLAVAAMVRRKAEERGLGTTLPGFMSVGED